MYDIGRIAGLGGPVEFDGGQLWLNEEHRAAIYAWVRGDAFRTLDRLLADGGED